MEFSTLTIQTETKKNRPTLKSRNFSVQLLGFLLADSFWEPGGNGSTSRPVWLAYAGTEQECQPFTANLRAGRKASTSVHDVLDLPKRSPHRWTTQKVPNGLITVAYIPDLFHLEPATLPTDTVRFLFAPPRWWVTEQAQALADEFGDNAEDAARAALFCAYLDRRTHLPLVHDLRFHLQVYRAAHSTPWLHPFETGRRGVLVGRGAEACGLDAPLACCVDASALAEFLIEQTSLFHQEEIRRGKTRSAASGRLLPYPAETPAQLRLDFAVA